MAEIRGSHPCSVLPGPIDTRLVKTIHPCCSKSVATTVATALNEHPFRNRLTTCTSIPNTHTAVCIRLRACVSQPGFEGYPIPPAVLPSHERHSVHPSGNQAPTPNTKWEALLLLCLHYTIAWSRPSWAHLFAEMNAVCPRRKKGKQRTLLIQPKKRRTRLPREKRQIFRPETESAF